MSDKRDDEEDDDDDDDDDFENGLTLEGTLGTKAFVESGNRR
jgi:hypothetical protein